MICQLCGVEAPTKQVSFHQNIGVLVMRFHQHVTGELCKSCIHKEFWKKTLISVTLGWWGMISFIVTPFFVINNVVRYATCVSLPPVPKGATAPVLDERAVERLNDVADRLIHRLNSGEPVEQVVKNIASLARVSEGQVHLYLRALVEAQRQEHPSA